MISRPKLHLPVQALVCVAAFGFGLPLAIALFPQTSEVRTYILSDVLMCNIAEYFFNELYCILTSPQGKSKYKQQIIGSTTHQKCLMSYLLSNCFFFLPSISAHSS